MASSTDADECSNLQQQYLAAGPGGGSTASSNTATDLAALNNSLQIAEAAAQSNHCSGGLFGLFGPSPSPACPQIMQQVGSLQTRIQQAYASSRAGGLFGGFFGPVQQLSPRATI